MSMIGGIGGGGGGAAGAADYFYKLMPSIFFKSGKESVEQLLNQVMDSQQYDSTVGSEASIFFFF